jgi:hypothetical protein
LCCGINTTDIQWCPTERRKLWLRNNAVRGNTISLQCPTARRKIRLRITVIE